MRRERYLLHGRGLVVACAVSIAGGVALANPAAPAKPDPSACASKLPPGALTLSGAETLMWSYYMRGPGSPSPRPGSVEAFPIACRVEAAGTDAKTKDAAVQLLSSIADCVDTGGVYIHYEGAVHHQGVPIGQLMERCVTWKPRRGVPGGLLDAFLTNMERLGLGRSALEMACIDQSADLVRPALAGNPDSAALTERLDRVVSMYHDAARCAGLGSLRTFRMNLAPQNAATQQVEAQQRAFNGALADRDTDHRLSQERDVRDESYHRGNGTTDAPDESAMLLRKAKDLLARNQPAQAVVVLDHAVQILTVAFGAADEEVKAATTERGRARELTEHRELAAECAALLPARVETPLQIMNVLRTYFRAGEAGHPVPPVVYGAACRALSGESAFAGEQWSDPLVTQPILRAAEETWLRIPAGAASEQANGLIEEASKIGLGPGPEFSISCPATLLVLAQKLLEEYRLPVDARIRKIRNQLKSARACARAKQGLPARP